MAKAYTIPEIKATLAQLQQIFDVARVVDPVCTAVTQTDQPLVDEAVARDTGCFSVWNGRGKRCANCISLRALREDERQSKFEFIDNDIYHVVALPIELEGRRRVLEIVSMVNDQVLLRAYGRNEFVQRITGFNTATDTDELTGLFNRRCFEEKLYLALTEAERNRTTVGVTLIDLDRMDELNHRYGHPAGDEALMAVGSLLTARVSTRRGDFVARHGADSFAVVMSDASSGVWKTRMGELLERISEVSLRGYESVRLTASAGGALSVQGDTVTTLMERVEGRLRSAQAQGGGMAVFEE